MIPTRSWVLVIGLAGAVCAAVHAYAFRIISESFSWAPENVSERPTFFAASPALFLVWITSVGQPQPRSIQTEIIKESDAGIALRRWMLPIDAGIRPQEEEGPVMAKVEFSPITINRPVEDVFVVLSKLEDTPKWSSTAIEAKITSAVPIGVGATARYVDKFLGRRFESEVEITEFEPNRKLTMQSTSGPFPFRGSLTLEGTAGRTQVSGTFEAEPGGFFKLAEPLLVRIGKRQFESDLANLKDLMEANAL